MTFGRHSGHNHTNSYGPPHVNPEVRFHWLGWVASSVDLMHHGWEISVRDDPHYMTLVFALRHPQYRIRGMSQSYYMDRREVLNQMYGYRDHRVTAHEALNRQQMWHPPVCAVDLVIGEQINLHLSDMSSLKGFEPLDATPQMMGYTVVELGHMPIFKTVNAPKEILLSEASIDQILTMANKLQAPKDKAYFEYKAQQELLAKNKPTALLRAVAA